MTGEMWGRASGDGSGEEEEATQGAGAPKKKKKKKRGCDRMKVEIMIGGKVCHGVCHPPSPICVCVVLISLFFGVCFFLLSRPPSLRIKQPAFRVES